MGKVSNIRSKPGSDIVCMVYDARGNGGGGTSPTITGDHQNRVTDYTAIVLEIHEEDNTNREEVL